jgi:hypothetical protein
MKKRLTWITISQINYEIPELKLETTIIPAVFKMMRTNDLSENSEINPEQATMQIKSV